MTAVLRRSMKNRTQVKKKVPVWRWRLSERCLLLLSLCERGWREGRERNKRLEKEMHDSGSKKVRGLEGRREGREMVEAEGSTEGLPTVILAGDHMKPYLLPLFFSSFLVSPPLASPIKSPHSRRCPLALTSHQLNYFHHHLGWLEANSLLLSNKRIETLNIQRLITSIIPTKH